MNTAARALLIDLIRGDTITTAEIDTHLSRLVGLGVELPDGWEHWPSELRAMEREGIVKQEGEGWWIWVAPKPKPAQTSLF
jgi:hypothetical protein